MKKAIFILLLFVACKEKNKAPNDLIDKDTMKHIIMDIAIFDAIVEGEKLESNKLLYNYKQAQYQNVFDKYSIDKENFIESYKYYLNNLDSANAMYDEIIEEISVKEAELNNK